MSPIPSTPAPAEQAAQWLKEAERLLANVRKTVAKQCIGPCAPALAEVGKADAAMLAHLRAAPVVAPAEPLPVPQEAREAMQQALSAMEIKQRVSLWENDTDAQAFRSAIASLRAAMPHAQRVAPAPISDTKLMESGQTGTDGSQKPNDADAIRSAKAGSIYSGRDPAEPRDDSDRSYSKPIGYVAATELSRLHSGHNADLRSARFGPSPLDGDIPVYIDQPAVHPSPAPQAALRIAGAAGPLGDSDVLAAPGVALPDGGKQ